MTRPPARLRDEQRSFIMATHAHDMLVVVAVLLSVFAGSYGDYRHQKVLMVMDGGKAWAVPPWCDARASTLRCRLVHMLIALVVLGCGTAVSTACGDVDDGVFGNECANVTTRGSKMMAAMENRVHAWVILGSSRPASFSDYG